MKAILLSSALAAFALATSASASVRVPILTSTFGDYMGTAPADKCTAQKHTFYGSDMKIVAVIETATNASGDDQITQHYKRYRYDELGQLVAIDSYQYGLYEYGDRIMKPSAGSVEYRYDAAGNMVEQIESGNSVSYEYDAEGNLLKEVRYSVNSYNGSVKEGKTLVYSDYVAPGKPGKAVSTHKDETLTGEFYEETYTYDDQLRLIMAYRECNVDKVVKIGSFTTIELVSGTFMQQENWTYEGDDLTLYEKFNNIDEESGELIPYFKTVYTKVSDTVTGHQSYTAFWMPGAETEWYKSGTYQTETVLDFEGMIDQTALQLVSVVQSPDAINTAILEFTQPQAAANGNVSYNIFRDGEFVANASLSAGNLELDAATGHLLYADRGILNGDHDYFVQTVMGDGFAPSANVPAPTQSYCVSDIVSADVHVVLPAVTNIRAVECVKDKNDDNYVTILFSEPEIPAELGFISNEIFVGNAQVPEDRSTDPTNNILHCTLIYDQAEVSILTRYKYGKALSERVTIDVNNLSSIEEVRALGDEQMQIFDLNGRQVIAPLESLHGQYIILSGKTAYKVILK